jgi:hypothetical protein
VADVAVVQGLLPRDSLEMAKNAGTGGHGHVLPLNDLGMAGGTPKFLAPSHLQQVGSVIKQDIAEVLLSGQNTAVMTSLP